MDRRTVLARTAPLALVALTGCTDGDATPTEEDGPTATPTPTDLEGETDSPTSSDARSPDETPTAETQSSTADWTPTPDRTPTSDPDREVVVGPEGRLRFEPRSFTVSAGDTVLWRWDSPGHNVSPSDGEQPAGAEWAGRDGSTYPAGTTYSYTFDVPGDYAYHCDPHQSSGMVGSFTVE